jgi:hypothetical protein
MTRGVRKLALTAHVATSVGWLGAAVSVLALAIVGLTGDEARLVASSYLGVDVVWRFVVVPLALAALATGLLQAIGTEWGLLRHRWVVAKLVLTSISVLLLLLHTSSLLPQLAAEAGASSSSTVASHRSHGGMSPRLHLVVAAGGTLLLLLATTAISVYKPWGLLRRPRK